MYNAATRVIPAITPQLLLFVTTYYSFAVIGMALFAGCVTEVVEDGGPGDWSTSNTTVGGPQWKDTMFAQADYYYQDNFDNLYASCMTLFMLMIQNNWHVTVDGFTQCTGTTSVRAYFISFNCVNSMILINIFIGVVLDMFDLYWHDEKYKMGLEAEDKFDSSFFKVVINRLDTKYTQDPDGGHVPGCEACEGCEKCGEPLSKTWGVSHEMDSGLLYSGVTPSDAVMVLSEVAKHTELRGLKAVLSDSPMPIYVRTSGIVSAIV